MATHIMNINIVGYSKISHFNMEFNLVMHYNQFGKHHLLSLTQLLSTNKHNCI